MERLSSSPNDRLTGSPRERIVDGFRAATFRQPVAGHNGQTERDELRNFHVEGSNTKPERALQMLPTVSAGRGTRWQKRHSRA
jgi:hypothetical protein